MKALIRLIILAALAAGCGDSSTSPRVFTDSLSLGTGRQGIDLVGETTTFTGGLITIYWRVESREKLKSADVEFMVEKYAEGGYETVYQTINGPAGPVSNVVIASYYHTFGPGLFRATGFIGSARRVVGPETFTVKEAVSP